MARFPGATWRPLDPQFLPGRRLTVHNRVNLHVTAGTGSPFGTFSRPGAASSHFYVAKDGSVEQFVDTDFQAEGDFDGNDATVSIETEGAAPGVDANAEPWTDAQLAALARLFAWVVSTHGVRVQLASDSKIGDSSKGLSWHRLGIDGNFPALPDQHAGRLQRGGGMHYSTSRGKLCPGNAKIDQIPGILAATGGTILAGSHAGAPVPVPAPAPAPAPVAGTNFGYSAAQIAEAQTLLNQAIGAGLATDGILGPLTKAATVTFQSSHGLTADGIPGPLTVAALHAALTPAPAPAGPVVIAPGVPAPPFPLPVGSYFGPKSGPVASVSGFYSHREDLRRWQQRMHDRGWVINPDGLYGNETAGVAHDFQVEKGLRVDSLIGPITWAAAWTEPITRN